MNASSTEDMHQAVLPHGLTWRVKPQAWRVVGERLSVTPGPSTDNFVDPSGTITVLNGALAMVQTPLGAWTLVARVTPHFRAAYDAGSLVVWLDDRVFAKLCFEQSARSEPTVVSVVTRGVSDDSTGWPEPGPSLWLRVSRLGSGAFAFHARRDGGPWNLARYFHLEVGESVEVGLGVQSPVGPGCTVEFTEVALSDEGPRNLHDGS